MGVSFGGNVFFSARVVQIQLKCVWKRRVHSRNGVYGFSLFFYCAHVCTLETLEQHSITISLSICLSYLHGIPISHFLSLCIFPLSRFCTNVTCTVLPVTRRDPPACAFDACDQDGSKLTALLGRMID